MRGLCAIVLAGCSVSIAGPAPSIEGFVLDPNGLVANADVRVTAVQPASCACKLKPDNYYDNATPACSCPASFATWQQRLAACVWPNPATTVLRSDKRGRVALPTDALGSMVETTGLHGVSWLALPARADRVGIELDRPITRKLRVDTSADLHAALLYDDGHCMPFLRDSKNVWVSAAATPDRSDDWPVLIVEAKGYATVVRSWYERGAELAIALHRDQSITGTCKGDRVTLANPYQHVVARVTSNRFSIADAVATDSTVTCTRKGKLVEAWSYSPGRGLVESDGISVDVGGDEPCHEVIVVDRGGTPLAGAEVIADPYPGSSHGGTIQTTDARGRACLELVVDGGEVSAHAPLARGGWCAGMSTLRITAPMLKKPIRVAVDIAALQRSPWRGHLRTPEGAPVVGAYIAVRDVAPTGTQCNESSEVVVASGVDGTFELPLMPHGTIKLDIKHPWYAEQELDITIPSREREIVLDRGVTWTGRVLDPDGKVIDRCSMFLTLPNQRLLTAQCSAQGFTFTTLVPGEAKVSVRVENSPLGKYRSLETKLLIKGTKPVREDIRWPAADSISGRAVDNKGAPIAGARLVALPKGVVNKPDRMDPDEVVLDCDADGRFEFRHLKAGLWEITGDRRTGKWSTHEIAAGSTDVELVLDR